MLGELLRSRLDQLGTTTVRRLHLTASSWFAAHDMPVEAFDHAARAQCWTSAAAILMDAWLSLYLDGKLVSLRELIDRLPAEIVADSELREVRTAVGLALRDGHLTTADGLTGAGFDSCTGSFSTPPVEAAAHDSAGPVGLDESFSGSAGDHPTALPTLVVDLVRARLTGDLVAAAGSAHRLLVLSESDDHRHSTGAADLRALALHQLGVTEYWAGRRSDSEAHLRAALSEATENGRAYVQLGCQGQLVCVLTAQNRLTDALREADAGLALMWERGWEFTGAAAELWHALGWSAFVRGELDLAEQHLEVATVAVRRQNAAVSTTVLLVRGLIKGLRGRKRDAVALLDEAARVRARLRARYVFDDYLLAEQVRQRLSRGDVGAARALLATYGDDPCGPVHLSIARAELLVSDGHPDLALELLVRACRTGQGLVDQHLQALVLLAVLQARAGDEKTAADTFCGAVELASPEWFVQPFLQFGRPVERLFRLAERHRPRIDRSFAEQVLEKAERLWAAMEGPGGLTAWTELEQRPTERELEVLRSLDSLSSLPEISASLFVSVNTLKAHLRSLYRKLGVGSRREAVAKARSLGLL